MISSLRAEKVSKNQDDVRVLISGIFFCIILLFVQTSYTKVRDTYFIDRPFVTASVKLFHQEQGLPPLILYKATTNLPVKGMWIATIYSENGTRLDSRRGSGNYIPNMNPPKFWDWGAFFSNEDGRAMPLVPTMPFYVCVRYDVEANRSNVTDSSDNFCSEVYDPNEKNFVIQNVPEEDIVK